MACDLINSQPLDCRDSFGGIKEIKVRVHPANLSNSSVVSGVITLSSSYLTGWFTYAMDKDIGFLNDNATVNVQNGSLFFAQELNLIVNKLEADKRNDLSVLAQNRLSFAVKDRNDEHWLSGYVNGLDLTTGNSGTGTAAGDRSGYDLTFSGMEPDPILSMSLATYDSLVTT